MTALNITLFASMLLFCGVFGAEKAARRSTSKAAEAMSGGMAAYMGDKIFTVFLDRAIGLETPKTYGAEIEIANQMATTTIANPRVYMEGGHNTVPPPLVIPPGNKEGNKNYLMSFATNAKLPLAQAVSSGIVAYEIRRGGNVLSILYIVWDVRKREVAEIFQRSGKNYFGVFIGAPAKLAAGQVEDWEKKLVQFLNDLKVKGGGNLQKSLYRATEVGEYVTVFDKALYVRAHMTDSNPAKMLVQVQDAPTIMVYKRDFGVSVGVGLVSVGLSLLTNRFINTLTATRTIVLTVRNEMASEAMSGSNGLKHPVWRSSGVEFVEPVPYEIPAGMVGQVISKVDIGMGKNFKDKFKNSVLVISYGIVGTTKRIVFVLKWQLAAANLVSKKHNWYSVFTLDGVDNEQAKGIQEQILLAVQANSDESVIQQKLGNFAKFFSNTNRFFVPLTLGGGPFLGYSAWHFPAIRGSKYTAITMLGNSVTAGELVVHLRKTPLSGALVPNSNPSYHTEQI